MRKRWLVCVLLGTLGWCQTAAPGTPPPQAAQPPAPAGAKAAAPAPAADTAAAVPADAAVITVTGVCPAKPTASMTTGTAAKPATAHETPAVDCKTVVTKAEFEKIANALSPDNPLTPPQRKQLASTLGRIIPLADKAKKEGLDKTQQFEDTVKFAEMQILSRELTESVQENAKKVPDADVEQYYESNAHAFEQFNVDRLYVPKTKQVEPTAKDKDEDDDKDKKLTEEQQKAKQAEEKAKAEQNEQDMTKLAETLRGRAAAGEDFVQLQKEAFEAAGMKIASPNVSLPKIRRNGLPPAHAAVFDLKAGEVSPVINDAGGHYIYKVNSKDELPLDQVKKEILSTLQNQRARDMMDEINNSFKVETNDAYFGPGGVAAGPPPRMPSPRMAPNPTPPTPQAVKPQNSSAPPVPAQSPATKPN